MIPLENISFTPIFSQHPSLISSHSSQLLSYHPHPPSLPLSHPNRLDLEKNQFPLPSGEAQCFTTVSDWWRADTISHPAAFYSTSELVAIQCIFMANNNRRCNSYSLWWVNLSRETRGWPAQTAGGQSHVNKLLRLNDWVHGCEGLGSIQQSKMKAVFQITDIQSERSVLKVTTTSTALILQSTQLLIYTQVPLLAPSQPITWLQLQTNVDAFKKCSCRLTTHRHVIRVSARGLVLLVPHGDGQPPDSFTHPSENGANKEARTHPLLCGTQQLVCETGQSNHRQANGPC